MTLELQKDIEVPSTYKHTDNSCTVKVRAWSDQTAWLAIECECGDLTANLKAPELLEIIGALTQAYAAITAEKAEEVMKV